MADFAQNSDGQVANRSRGLRKIGTGISALRQTVRLTRVYASDQLADDFLDEGLCRVHDTPRHCRRSSCQVFELGDGASRELRVGTATFGSDLPHSRRWARCGTGP